MKKLILSVILFAFLFLATSFNVHAQSSDCRREWSERQSVCGQGNTQCNACATPNSDPACSQECNKVMDVCTQASNTLSQCLGIDKNPIKLQTSRSGHINCEEWKRLMIAGTAQNCTVPTWTERELKCLSSVAEISQAMNHPADYVLDFDPGSCLVVEGDLGQFKAGLPITPMSSSITPISGNNSGGKVGSLNVFSISPLETLRNIQALLQIPQGLNDLVETGEFLSGTKEIPIVVPEPSIATDKKGNPWDFLPGYIPHESIEPGKLVRVKETIRLSDKDNQTYLELRPGQSGQAVLKIPGKSSGDQPLLEEGEVEVVKVKSGVSDSGYDGIRTPNGTVVSVQTHYLVSYDKKKSQTTVAVYEGRVEVKTNDGKTTTVSPNDGKPGVVVVSQKLSVIKLAVGVALVVFAGLILVMKKKR